MREIMFVPNIPPKEKKFLVDNILKRDTFNLDENFLEKDNSGIRIHHGEKVEEAIKNEVIKITVEVVDRLFEELVNEMRSAQLNVDEKTLYNDYLDKSDFLGRLILNFDKKHNYSKNFFSRKGYLGAYSPISHKILIDVPQISKNRVLDEPKLIHVLSHEFAHFCSFSFFSFTKKEQKDKIVLPLDTVESGVSISEKERVYCEFNEAITDKFALELSAKIFKTLGVPSGDYKLINKHQDVGETEKVSDAKYAKAGYADDIEILNMIIKYLAMYSGVSEKMVWNSWKRAYFEGGVLKDPVVVKHLRQAFGEDFLENFLKKLKEKNVKYCDLLKDVKHVWEGGTRESKTLERRWQANGALAATRAES